MSLEDIKLYYDNNTSFNNDINKLLKYISFSKNSSLYIFNFIKYYVNIFYQNNLNDIKDLYDEFLEWIRILRPSAKFLLNNLQFKEELYYNNQRNINFIKNVQQISSNYNQNSSMINQNTIMNIIKSFNFDSFLSRPFYPSKFLIKSSIIGLHEDDLFINYNNTENFYNFYFSLPSYSTDLLLNTEVNLNVPGNIKNTLQRTRTKKEYESFVKLIQNNYESYQLNDYNLTKNNELIINLLINYGKEIIIFKFNNEKDYYHFILGLKYNKKFNFISYQGKCYHDYNDTIERNIGKKGGGGGSSTLNQDNFSTSSSSKNKKNKKDKAFISSLLYNNNNLCEFTIRDSCLIIKPVVALKIGISSGSTSDERSQTGSYSNPSSLDQSSDHFSSSSSFLSSSSSSSSSLSSNTFCIPLDSIIALVINADYPDPKTDLLHCSLDLEHISSRMLDKNKIKIKNSSNPNLLNLRFLLKINTTNHLNNKIYSMPLISTNYFTEYKIGGVSSTDPKEKMKKSSIYQSFVEYDCKIFNNSEKNMKISLFLLENNTIISKANLKNLFFVSNQPLNLNSVGNSAYSAKLIRKFSANYEKKKKKNLILKYRNFTLLKFNLLKKTMKKFLIIRIIQAEDLNDSNKGTAPSPYCVLIINSDETKKRIKSNFFSSNKTYQTDIKLNSYSPIWNKTFLLDIFNSDISGQEELEFPFSSITIMIKDSSSGILQHKHLGMITLGPECFLSTKVSLKLPLEETSRMSESPRGSLTIETELATIEDYNDLEEEELVEVEDDIDYEMENDIAEDEVEEESKNEKLENEILFKIKNEENDNDENYINYTEEFNLEDSRDFIPISYQILHTTSLSTWWPYKLISHKVFKNPAVFSSTTNSSNAPLSSEGEDLSEDEDSTTEVPEITDPYHYMDGHILTHPYGLLLNIHGNSILSNMKINLINSIPKDSINEVDPLLIEEIINNPSFLLIPWNQVNRVLEVSKSTVMIEILVENFFKNSINTINSSIVSFTSNIVSSLNPIGFPSSNTSSSSSHSSNEEILLEIIVGPCNSKLLISAIENRLRNNNVRLLVNARDLLIIDNSKTGKKLTKNEINSITFSKLLDQINKIFLMINQELNKKQHASSFFSVDLQHSITDLIVNLKEIKKILFKQYKYINSKFYKEILFEQVTEVEKESHVKYKIQWENIRFSLFISLLDHYPISLLNHLLLFSRSKGTTIPLSLSNESQMNEQASSSKITSTIVDLVNYAYPETASILPIEIDNISSSQKVKNRAINLYLNTTIANKLKQVIENLAKKINLLQENYSLNTDDFVIKIIRLIQEEMIPLIFSFRQFLSINNIKYDIKEGISVIAQSFWNFYHDFICDFLISFKQFMKIKGVNNQSLFSLFLLNELELQEKNESFFVLSIRPLLSLLFNLKIKVPLIFNTLNIRYCYAYDENKENEKKKLTKRDSYNPDEEKSIEIIQNFIIKKGKKGTKGTKDTKETKDTKDTKDAKDKENFIKLEHERKILESKISTLQQDNPGNSIRLWYLSILLGQITNCILNTLELGKASDINRLITLKEEEKSESKEKKLEKNEKKMKNSKESERLLQINSNLTHLNGWEIIKLSDGERLTHLPAILIGQLKIILEYSITYRNLRKKIISNVILKNANSWYTCLNSSDTKVNLSSINLDEFLYKLKSVYQKESLENIFLDNFADLINNQFFRKILTDEEVNEIVKGLDSAAEYDENDGENFNFNTNENELLSSLIQYAYTNHSSSFNLLYITNKLPYILIYSMLYIIEEYFKKLKSSHFFEEDIIDQSSNSSSLSILPAAMKKEIGCTYLNELLISIINDLHYIEHHSRVLLRISSGNRSTISSLLVSSLRPPIIRVQRAAAVKIMRGIYDDLTISLLNFDEMWLQYVNAITINEDNTLQHPISHSNFYNPVKNITSYIISTCTNLQNRYGCHICDLIEILNLSFDILITRFLMMFKHRIKSSNSNYAYQYHNPTKKWSSNSKISLNLIQSLSLKNDAIYILTSYNDIFKQFIETSTKRNHHLEKDFLIIINEFYTNAMANSSQIQKNQSNLSMDPISPYHLLSITSFYYFSISISANYDSLDFINSIRWIIKNAPIIEKNPLYQTKTKETPLTIVNHLIYNVILQLRPFNNDACSFYQDCIENLIQEKDVNYKAPFRSSTIVNKVTYESPLTSPFLGSLHTNVTIKDALFKTFYVSLKNGKNDPNSSNASTTSNTSNTSYSSSFSLTNSTSRFLKVLKSNVPKIKKSEDAFVRKLVSMLFGDDPKKSSDDYVTREDDIIIYDDLKNPLYKLLDNPKLENKSISIIISTYLNQRNGKSFKNIIESIREDISNFLKEELILSRNFESKEIKERKFKKKYEAETIKLEENIVTNLKDDIKISSVSNEFYQDEEIKEDDTYSSQKLNESKKVMYSASASESTSDFSAASVSVSISASASYESIPPSSSSFSSSLSQKNTVTTTQKLTEIIVTSEFPNSTSTFGVASVSSSLTQDKINNIYINFKSLQIKYINLKKNDLLFPTIAITINGKKQKIKLNSNNIKYKNESIQLESNEEISYTFPSSIINYTLKLPIININIYTKNFITKKKHYYSKISIENLNLLTLTYKLEKINNKNIYSSYNNTSFNLYENEENENIIGKINIQYKISYDLK